MDFFVLLFLSAVSILFGIILTLVLQYYVLLNYFNKGPEIEPKKKVNHEAYCLPEALKKSIEDDTIDEKSSDTSLPISLMLQFLFHELRYSDSIKRWLYKKLSMEFDELLTKTTIGKFFEAVTIQDMNLGTQFPDIQNIKLDSIKLDKTEGHIDTLNLSVELDYTGNFLLSVDAKMKFGKTAYLSIKVKRISGKARLQFTRVPYTHWSFSFYNEPIMDFAVESHFQGRQLQANVTNLIVNQIKKAIKRKHTLPNYKIRYKPFFMKTDPGQLDTDENDVIPQGQLEVTCGEVTRLATSSNITNVHCTFTIDSQPFIALFPRDHHLYILLDLTITKQPSHSRNNQLGVVFKQLEGTNNGCLVTVDSVTQGSAAQQAGLRPHDVIVTVDGKPVTGVQHVGRLIRGGSGSRVAVRVERGVQEYVLRARDKNTSTTTTTTNNTPHTNTTTTKQTTPERTDDKTPSTTTSSNIINSELSQSSSAPLDLTVNSDGDSSFVIVDHVTTPSNKNEESIVESAAITTPANNATTIVNSVSNNTATINDTISNPATNVTNASSGSRRSKCMQGIDRLKGCDRSMPRLLLSSGNDNMSKFAQTIGNFSLRKRKQSGTSLDRGASSDSGGSNRSTPTASNQGTPQHVAKSHHQAAAAIATAANVTPNINLKKHSISEVPEIVRTDLDSEQTEVLSVEGIEVFQGKQLELSSVIQFKDDFLFNLKDDDKYLNVNVWGTTKDNEEILLGYTNICLAEVLNECVTSMLGHYIKRYWFLPPNNTTPTNQTHPLMVHSGFEHVFCYGDILLSFVWNPDDLEDVKRKYSTISASDIDIKPAQKEQIAQHDFVRTQFHRSVHCDFCSKKIWLKDAVQCRECGLCCHKKCISKCQTSTDCMPADKNSLKSEVSDLSQPEIIMTEHGDEEMGEESPHGISALKRINSANNLNIPGGAYISPTSPSLSLPPSPQRTPSRKHSLVMLNPFSLCPLVLADIIEADVGQTAASIDRLLEQVMLCPPDELLMDAAKDTGRTLYTGMSQEEKLEKINAMMAALKRSFDTVTIEHAELQRQLTSEVSEVEKAKVAFLMGQADAKMHSLSVLMLHYCSGLQQTNEKIV